MLVKNRLKQIEEKTEALKAEQRNLKAPDSDYVVIPHFGLDWGFKISIYKRGLPNKEEMDFSFIEDKVECVRRGGYFMEEIKEAEEFLGKWLNSELEEKNGS